MKQFTGMSIFWALNTGAQVVLFIVFLVSDDFVNIWFSMFMLVFSGALIFASKDKPKEQEP